MRECLGENLLSLVVSQSDALRGHLEVDDGGGRGRAGGQRLGDGLSDGLGPGQGLHFHRVDVQDVAGWKSQSRIPWKINMDDIAHITI